MTRIQQPALTLFAVGMIGLGTLALIYGDFALVWQHVAAWIPGRTVLAYGSGLVMLLGGFGLLLRPTAAWSARVLFPYLILWLLLKVPALVAAPQVEAVWLGFGEIVVLMTGGWILFARLGGGVGTIRQYLEAGLIDEMHIAISPILLGAGEHLFNGINMLEMGHQCAEHVATARAMHFVLRKEGG